MRLVIRRESVVVHPSRLGFDVALHSVFDLRRRAIEIDFNSFRAAVDDLLKTKIQRTTCEKPFNAPWKGESVGKDET